MKTCRICKLEQSLDCFHLSSKSKFGRDDRCKNCCKETRREYHCMNDIQLNSLRTKKELDKKNQLNLLAIAGEKSCVKCGLTKQLFCFSKTSYGLGFNLACKECKNKESKNRYINNSKEVIKKTKKYQKDNKEKCSKRASLNYQKNKDRVLKRTKEYTSNKRKTDHVFKLSMSVRGRISSFLRSKSISKNKKTSSIIGCSFQELAIHIEKQFLKGMTWKMVMSGEIHIDHIVPLASAKTEEDVISLNHFTNLRPLFASDNLKKSSKREFLI